MGCLTFIIIILIGYIIKYLYCFISDNPLKFILIIVFILVVAAIISFCTILVSDRKDLKKRKQIAASILSKSDNYDILTMYINNIVLKGGKSISNKNITSTELATVLDNMQLEALSDIDNIFLKQWYDNISFIILLNQQYALAIYILVNKPWDVLRSASNLIYLNLQDCRLNDADIEKLTLEETKRILDLSSKERLITIQSNFRKLIQYQELWEMCCGNNRIFKLIINNGEISDRALYNILLTDYNKKIAELKLNLKSNYSNFHLSIVGYLTHCTHRSNLKSIIECGELLSYRQIIQRQIACTTGGNDLSHSLDKKNN